MNTNIPTEPTPESWLWPDRTIGKGESRILREEHNALVNRYVALAASVTAVPCESERLAHLTDDQREAIKQAVIDLRVQDYLDDIQELQSAVEYEVEQETPATLVALLAERDGGAPAFLNFDPTTGQLWGTNESVVVSDPAERLVQRLHAEAEGAGDAYLAQIEEAFFPDDPKRDGEQTASRVFAAIDSADSEDLARLGAVVFGYDDPDVSALMAPESGQECPNCMAGTVGLENGQLVCRGECGTIWAVP